MKSKNQGASRTSIGGEQSGGAYGGHGGAHWTGWTFLGFAKSGWHQPAHIQTLGTEYAQTGNGTYTLEEGGQEGVDSTVPVYLQPFHQANMRLVDTCQTLGRPKVSP
jgi:hypothetical protein